MNLETIGKRIILLGLILLIIFTTIFLFNSTKLNLGPINTEVWSHYAGVVSGIVGTIFALVGVLFLIINLSEQRKVSSRQEVENRFFELIKLHRDNIDEMGSKGKVKRAVFIEIKDEFHELHKSVKLNYTFQDSNKSEIEWQRACIQITYLIVFFGVNNSSTNYLKKLISAIISDDKAEKILSFSLLDSLISTHANIKESNRLGLTNFYLPYDGHQSRIGHYFRHLFQTVKYINDQPSNLFSFEEKYNYAKTLRAQFSTHEQALFMYNAISPLGAPWELSSEITDVNNKLITKYNLIKNIPEDFTRDINPKDFFPDVFYEFDSSPTSSRLELQTHYH